MKLRSTILTVFAVCISMASMAKPVAVLAENSADYTQTEDGYIVNFDLQATSAEYLTVSNKAAEMNGTLNLVAVEDGVNNYDCTLTITHQNHPEYVHKMMLTLGITTLIYKEITHPIIYIVDILYSFL